MGEFQKPLEEQGFLIESGRSKQNWYFQQVDISREIVLCAVEGGLNCSMQDIVRDCGLVLEGDHTRVVCDLRREGKLAGNCVKVVVYGLQKDFLRCVQVLGMCSGKVIAGEEISCLFLSVVRKAYKCCVPVFGGQDALSLAHS